METNRDYFMDGSVPTLKRVGCGKCQHLPEPCDDCKAKERLVKRNGHYTKTERFSFALIAVIFVAASFTAYIMWKQLR